MTTLLYGNKPEVDVAPGNRVDSENGGPSVPAPPPTRPTYPTPSPWVRREAITPPPRGLRAILGVAAASVIAACIAYVASARRVTA